MNRFYRKKQGGQVLVLILLVTLIGLTVGLSITSRTLQDLRSTTVTDQSSRAFTAAEAGIEEALRSGASFSGSGAPSPVPLTDSNNPSKEISTYEFTTDEAGGGTEPFIFPEKIARDDTQQIWLIRHKTDGSLDEINSYVPATLPAKIDVCWGDSTTINGQTPAIEISVIYLDPGSGTYKIAKGSYDPNSGRVNGLTKMPDGGRFVVSSCGIPNSGVFKVTYTLPSGVINEAIRMRLLYNDTAVTLAVAPVDGAVLPPQGKIISSTGRTTDGITRKVEVFRSYPTMPGIFDFVLFNGNQNMALQK